MKKRCVDLISDPMDEEDLKIQRQIEKEYKKWKQLLSSLYAKALNFIYELNRNLTERKLAKKKQLYQQVMQQITPISTGEISVITLTYEELHEKMLEIYNNECKISNKTLDTKTKALFKAFPLLRLSTEQELDKIRDLYLNKTINNYTIRRQQNLHWNDISKADFSETGLWTRLKNTFADFQSKISSKKWLSQTW